MKPVGANQLGFEFTINDTSCILMGIFPVFWNSFFLLAFVWLVLLGATVPTDVLRGNSFQKRFAYTSDTKEMTLTVFVCQMIGENYI